eukprot:jgi/Tetstr1/430394/TSEL_020204.t1
MREAWGRLQAATVGHLSDAYARVLEREAEAASGSQKELTAFLDQANNSRLRNEVCALPVTCRERILFNQLDAGSGMWTVAIPTARTVMTPHDLREHDAIADAFRDHCVHDLIVVREEVDDLFQQAVPLGNTIPKDELKNLLPDAELCLPAFNIVTGSYDPRSLKSALLEFKTMRYGVKYTAVPRATAVDRFERSLLGDIQRGLAARDAAWHNTEPGQKSPLRNILDMSEYTGMVFYWHSGNANLRLAAAGELGGAAPAMEVAGASAAEVTAELSRLAGDKVPKCLNGLTTKKARGATGMDDDDFWADKENEEQVGPGGGLADRAMRGNESTEDSDQEDEDEDEDGGNED